MARGRLRGEAAVEQLQLISASADDSEIPKQEVRDLPNGELVRLPDKI